VTAPRLISPSFLYISVQVSPVSFSLAYPFLHRRSPLALCISPSGLSPPARSLFQEDRALLRASLFFEARRVRGSSQTSPPPRPRQYIGKQRFQRSASLPTLRRSEPELTRRLSPPCGSRLSKEDHTLNPRKFLRFLPFRPPPLSFFSLQTESPQLFRAPPAFCGRGTWSEFFFFEFLGFWEVFAY